MFSMLTFLIKLITYLPNVNYLHLNPGLVSNEVDLLK